MLASLSALDPRPSTPRPERRAAWACWRAWKFACRMALPPRRRRCKRSRRCSSAGSFCLPEGEHSNVIGFTPPLTISAKPTPGGGERPRSEELHALQGYMSYIGHSRMKLTEMKQVLAERGIRLTKSLGQNFLHDANQLRRIVAAAELKKADRVLEIGPGPRAADRTAGRAGGRGPGHREGRATGGGAQTALPDRDRRDARPALAPRRRPRLPEARGARLERVEAGRQPALTPSPRRFWWSWPLGGRASRGPQAGPRRMVATLQIEVAKRLMARPGDAGLRRAHAAGPTRLRTAALVQDSGQLLLPGAGRGFGLRLPGAPRAEPLLPPEQRRSVHPNREAQLLAAAQDDAQTAQAGLA